MDIIGKTITFLLTISVELVISWKIAHALKNWKNTNKKEDFQSKFIASIILVSLIFMFLISTIMIHALITNELVDIHLIYMTLILLVGYMSTIYILYRCFEIKTVHEKPDNEINEEGIPHQQKKKSH